MKISIFTLCLLLTLLSTGANPAFSNTLNIAHRGACGYLPEHTLPAKALAYGMGADYIEQDIVLTADDVPLVIHDIHLDTVTNVAQAFPDRKREDGRFYVIDFTFAEIKTLKVTERFKIDSKEPVFPKRFPIGNSSFSLHSLQEEIELIQGLNKSTGKKIGIYPEIKEPAWHRKEGKDISRIVIDILTRYGYKKHQDLVFLQCFDYDELKRIKNELKCELKLIQLMEASDTYDLKDIALYADGIGPSIAQIISGYDPKNGAILTQLVSDAHKNNLKVHPYTFRVDSLPPGFSPELLMNILLDQGKIDGIFSDFPDISGQLIRAFVNSPKIEQE